MTKFEFASTYGKFTSAPKKTTALYVLTFRGKEVASSDRLGIALETGKRMQGVNPGEIVRLSVLRHRFGRAELGSWGPEANSAFKPFEG